MKKHMLWPFRTGAILVCIFSMLLLASCASHEEDPSNLAAPVVGGGGGGGGGIPALPGTITLSWTAPGFFVNGTAIGVGQITSYNIYFGTVSGTYGAVPFNTASTATTATVTGLTPGTLFFLAVTAVGVGGESNLSNEVSATTP